jgi:cardiolipin synthase
MQAAALGGVDVRLMISKRTDTPLLDPAIQSYYDGLLRAGVKIHEMQDAFIHAKTMVVDDYISVIGSTNMDFRSFEQSFEINCYMYDPKIAEQNKKIFFEDAKRCKELILEEWVNRAWWRKGFESIIRLFAPLL